MTDSGRPHAKAQESTPTTSQGATMVENTAQRDPYVHVLGVLSEGQSGYIEGMEAAGQRQVVASTQMPTEAPWEALTELGFTRGADVPGDPMFCDATLPEGWTKAGTDHSMWSKILDERGVERVSIFYKAAFYDRSAHASIARPGGRFATEVIYGDGEPALPALWDVLTEDERADFWADLDAYAAKATDPLYVDIYADRLPRVTAVLALR